MSKTVENTLLERRSKRRYTRDKISQEDIQFIYDAIRNTPTSYNGQQYSVIDIDDQQLKEKLYELTNQKQIKTCNHFMIFCTDYNKIAIGAKAKDVDFGFFSETADGYTVGVIDASLAMMSAIVAAESRGLGTCPIGYIRTVNPQKVAELIGLPENVAIVCGLAIGIPSENPDMKPKQSGSLLIHHNQYRQDNLKDEILDFDNEVSEYNRTRAGSQTTNDWISHIVGYYKEGEAKGILSSLKGQGVLKRDI